MPFLEAPAQKPFEESHLFADGAVPHILFVTQEIHILVQAELIEVFKGYIFLELFEVVSPCSLEIWSLLCEVALSTTISCVPSFP